MRRRGSNQGRTARQKGIGRFCHILVVEGGDGYGRAGTVGGGGSGNAMTRGWKKGVDNVGYGVGATPCLDEEGVASI